jgi:hypothetical protein
MLVVVDVNMVVKSSMDGQIEDYGDDDDDDDNGERKLIDVYDYLDKIIRSYMTCGYKKKVCPKSIQCKVITDFSDQSDSNVSDNDDDCDDDNTARKKKRKNNKQSKVNSKKKRQEVASVDNEDSA